MLRSFFLTFFFIYCASNAYEINGECPIIPYQSVLFFQCPPFTDLRCVRAMTRTKNGPQVINCALVDAVNDSEMRIVNASVLLQELKENDAFGRPICSIVMFYAPNCVFSRRIAGYVYSLAKLFPQLRVLALNVHQRSSLLDQLINQHGIAATPVTFLFENNVARIRLYDENSSFRALVKILLKQTDLKLPPGVKPEHLDTYGNGSEELRTQYNEYIQQFFGLEEAADGIDRYFIAACIVLIINVLYFTKFSQHIPQLWRN